MNTKKRILIAIFVVIIVITAFFIYEKSYLINNKIDYFYRKYLQANIKQKLVDNEYKKNQTYEFVSINKATDIKNEKELKNAIYTFLDSGWDSYTVFCNVNYLNCTSDVKRIVEDKNYITNISNFVHPFNTFEEFKTSISSSGKIIFRKTNRYSKYQINELNEKVDEIYNKYYDKSKNKRENIKIFHDYIINNTKYDKENKNGSSKMLSSNAYGVLIKGTGICSGYSDAISLFLNKLNIKNYRISSKNHMWNLVFVDGKWKHLDLTWDDPINSNGTDSLSDKYFLVTTDELKNIKDDEHDFDENIYIEAK